MPLDASNARDLPTRALSERAGRGFAGLKPEVTLGLELDLKLGLKLEERLASTKRRSLERRPESPATEMFRPAMLAAPIVSSRIGLAWASDSRPRRQRRLQTSND